MPNPAIGVRRRRVVVIAAALTVAATVGCSSDSSDSNGSDGSDEPAQAGYCDAWSNTVDAFEAYQDIDIVEDGPDSVRAYLDKLDQAVRDLAGAVDEQVQPEVDAFETAVQDLADTVTSTSLPLDRRDEVEAAASDVQSSWDDLAAAARPDCPDVSAPTGR